jgi:NAD(P)-dependent dehydrogenase (short-subunit alcohol dehydrogenase family)
VLDIQGKWVLLTGASRGVGRQVAGALADKGCHLILHSRKREHTAALVAELQARGLTVHALEAELSDQDQVIALGEEALNISAGLDILYNNAAVQSPWHEDLFKSTVQRRISDG